MNQLELLKSESTIDNFYYDLVRSLLLRIVGAPFYKDCPHQPVLNEIDFILHQVSKRWGLKFPLTRLQFGIEEFSPGKPFLKIGINECYSSEIKRLEEFCQKEENWHRIFSDISIIFEVVT